MADPLRRTLLAKLRGKKSKKGATLGGGSGGGGYGSSTAAAVAVNGGREGKEKVLQTQQRDSDEAPAPVVMFTGLDHCTTTERMSTYENYVEGAMVQSTGGVVIVREWSGGIEGGGGRVRVNEELLGVSLQRDVVHFGGDAFRDPDRSHRSEGKITLSAGLPLSVGGPHVHQRNHFVSVPRQCSVGDSIGFGDNSNHVLYQARVKPHSGVCKPAKGPVTAADSVGTEPGDCRGQPWHMAGTVRTTVTEHNANLTFDNNQTLERISPVVRPNSEETLLIRDVESYGPGYAGLQSPTFFPTELDICDINVASLCATETSLRFTLNSEDDDYYDNEILPFYETIRAKSESDSRAEVVAELPQPCLERGGQLDDSHSALQETDRLRNQLKEAYYLLINAMNDINLDVQQMSVGLDEQQATSSCSSHSRDSLCSRISAKNMDSDSWSSGGDHSPQQVSDTDSLLLCLTGNLESGLRDILNSKSMLNLSLTKIRPKILRSASDGAIRYPGGPQSPGIGLCGGEKGGAETKEDRAKVTGVDELSDNAISSEELLQDAGVDEDRSGSVNSLTGSSDSNQGSDNKQEMTEVRTHRADSFNKGHGVTVNKMQEWMHKGRLLSWEMKQRIEGSSVAPPPPRQSGGQSQDRCCPPQASRGGVKSVKAPPALKTPRQQNQHQQQSAFIENVQTPCANGRAGESPLSSWRQPLTTITVSKKRNWLQQSSIGKSHCTKDESQGMLGAEEEGQGSNQQPPPAPSPSPDHLRPSRPLRLQLPQVSVGQSKASPHCRSVDPAEENDADDEGEIWYNPIPEDFEADTSQRPSVRLLVPPHAELQRRPSRGGDVGGQGGRILGGVSGSGNEALLGESPVVVGVSVEGSQQGNAIHSTEAALHLHRQMLACKPQEEGGPSTSRTTDGPDLPNVVSSPPSSPNPAKKSSSINWSFPDKIKSPRTVRKISMRMKKLPELSRKLSVKGTSSSSSSSNTNNGSSQPEPRAHSPRNNNGTGSEAAPHSSGPTRLGSSGGGGQASRNVISRYHLDSSVSTQHSFSKKKNNGSSKSASKGGYLSDGDSPELVAKSGKHGSTGEGGKAGKGKETPDVGGVGSSKLSGTDLDIDAFRHYSFTEQPKCGQYISGLMSLHFYGAEDLKPPRVDSRDVYCAIQVDSVNKARTALLTCRTTFLDMDHTFNIELENAQHLKLVVFSWEPTPKRNRVCCHGTVVLPALFRVTRSHQLAVKLEPRGLIYVKLNLMDQWKNSLDGGGPDGDREPQVFGVEAWRVAEREGTGHMVPLLISKCINEIEKRGCQVVGLYRLCGSAAVKKELREAFERDSYAVELCENTYPDVNVITGVLKDYLRELPYPLITKHLYEAVLESMAVRPLRIGPGGCENDQADTEHTVSLLDNLPEVERMTLRRLLDHLKLVASYQEVNKMTCQNLAVCFGPVLLSQRQDASCHTNRVFIDSEELASALHFKKHIEVLHYLLQLWPVVDPLGLSSAPAPAARLTPPSSELLSAPPIRRRKERPQVLNLSEAEMAGVLRPKAGRLDSPSNRYAGDWSRCGESYFPCDMMMLLPPPPISKEEADYADVPFEDTEVAVEGPEKTEDIVEDIGERVTAASSPVSDPANQEPPEREEEVVVEEENEEVEEEKQVEIIDGSGDSLGDSFDSGQPLEDKCEELEEEEEEERVCDHHILPPRLPKEHSYQAYMKIQDISPVLSNRVNLRDLQESIDTLIGNLERELNKNKLNAGY